MKIKLSLFLALSATCGPVFAQAITPQIQRDALREQQRDLERAQQRENEFREAQQSAPSGSEFALEESATVLDGDCVRITRTEIEGLQRYPESDFAGGLEKLVGECTAAQAIDDVLKTITNRFVADGFITSRAVIVTSELAEGLLKIIVVEGIVDQISSTGRDGSRAYGSGELALAFPGIKNKRLNLRDLEQGVDQLARLRSGEANIDILPAETPGASDIVIARRRLGSWIRPSLSLSNDGSSRTGQLQGTVGLDVDNPLGIADTWSFYYSKDLNGEGPRGTTGYGGFVSIPYGYTTLSVSVGRSSYDSVLESNGLFFASGGDTTNGSVSVDQLVYRDGKTKLSISGRLALLDTENTIQQIRLSTNSYRLVTAGLNARLQRRLGNWFLFTDLGYTRGLDVLGANVVDLGPGSPGVTFNKLTASVSLQSYLKAFGLPFLYSGSISGAANLDPVLSAERFNLGGKYTIRGFRDDGISGRYGAFFRHQLAFGLTTLFKESKHNNQARISLAAGYDAGGILPRTGDPFERGFMQSSSVGIQIQSRRLQAEFSVSTPISAPSTVFHKDAEFSAEIRINI